MTIDETKSFPPPTAIELESAIDKLVTGLMCFREWEQQEYNKKRVPAHEAEPLKILDISTLFNTPDSVMRERCMVKNPINRAIKDRIKEIGQLLYNKSGRTVLEEAFDRITEKDPRNVGRRAAILDSAFNGIGKGDDIWAN